ncbi:MAG: type VI secretion system protein TssA [Pseudomonadota bacterium]
MTLQGHDINEASLLDLESLLTPIPGENPGGESLRYEGTYDRIQEARREDADLPQGVWKRKLKKADWPQVKELCLDALANRSKDLQIGVWLLEPLLNLSGFLGLREGLGFLLALLENFWEHLYPEIEGEELESRVSPLVWLNEKLYLQLKMIRITQPESVEALPHTFADWEKAAYLENLADGKQDVLARAEANGTITRSKFLGSVMFTPRKFYEEQSSYLDDSLEILQILENILDERCGKQAPGLNQFRATIEDIQRVVNDFLMEKKTEMIEEDEMERSDEVGVEETALMPLEEGMELENRPSSPQIRSRAEAYRMLSAVADYLIIHEPHSPTPYLVKRAVAWGNMTLTELLRELVSENNDLQQIFKLLGIKGMDRR